MKKILQITLMCVCCLVFGRAYAQTLGTVDTVVNRVSLYPYYSGDNIPAVDAEISVVEGEAFDAAGNLYLTDGPNERIRKVDNAGIITTIAGNGVAGYIGDGNAATAANLNNPTDVAVDVAGNIYIIDGGNMVRKINTSGIISTIAGHYNVNVGAGNGGPATDATFAQASCVAVDAAGNVYVGDGGTVREINSAGVINLVVGGGAGGDNVPATDASIGNVSDIAFDPTGNMYIADAGFYGHGVIRKVNTSGIITTIPNVWAGPGVATDAVGNVYATVIDPQSTSFSNAIYAIRPDSTIDTIVSRSEPYDFFGGLAVSASGSVYACHNYSPYFGLSVFYVLKITPATCSSVSAGSIVSTAGTAFCYSDSSMLTLSGATLDNYNAPDGHVAYQWQSSADGISWMNVGADTIAYSTGLLSSTTYYRDIVTCAASGMADTATTTLQFGATAPAAVSISTSPGTTICAGSGATFTATPLNGGGGNNPAYQWFKNGAPVGTGATYTDNGLVNNDSVSCVMTSTLSCASPATATGSVVMTVSPLVTPTVTISHFGSDSTCQDYGGYAGFQFTATVTNGGDNPSFAWVTNQGGFEQIHNNADVGADYAVPVGGAGPTQIFCIVTSSAACTTTDTAISDTSNVYVGAVMYPPNIRIIAVANNGNTIDTTNYNSANLVDTAGNTITFSATPIATDTTDEWSHASAYWWTLNGQEIPGATDSVYTTSSFESNDVIGCYVFTTTPCGLSPVPSSMYQNEYPVTITIFTPGVYCEPITTEYEGYFNDFVTTGGILNFTDTNGYEANGYIFDSTDTVSTTPGGTVSCSFHSLEQNNLSYAQQFEIWVDWNQDKIFEQNENVYDSVLNYAGDSVTIHVTVPLSAMQGATRMRVSCEGSGTDFSNDPCGVLDEGMSKDYVFITSCAGGAGVAPAATITANPGTDITTGQSVTFTATIANGVPNTTYQWRNNGANIAGATNNTYTSSTLADGNIITCAVYGNNTCVTPDSTVSNAVTMHVSSAINNIGAGSDKIQLYPNPNNGSFLVAGNVGSGKEVQIEVTDVVGQVVYRENAPVINGILRKQIALPTLNANGIYLMRIKTDSGSSVINFVVER